jgi:rare lipoprotein A
MIEIANRSRGALRFSILAGGVLLAGCALHDSTAIEHAAIERGTFRLTGSTAPHHAKWSQFGKASWYGSPFQGQPTASGEAFDMYQMTCAHRSLPLGALVRVTNLHNHRSVVVRVNDRGPQLHTRIVDLSYGAARILRFHGMTRVRLDLIDPSPSQEEVARLSDPD